MEEYIRKNQLKEKLRSLFKYESFPIADIEQIIDGLPAIPKHGKWIKMSDADGIYYTCSECGNDLPRVINSFDPQIDLFPKLKCIDKTIYCPNCGAHMIDEVE